MILSRLLEKTISNNASIVTWQLINFLKLPITKTTLVDTIEAHPDFPSLYSISDSLRRWNIDTVALKAEKDDLENIPCPFIAHLRKSHSYFSLIIEAGKNSVKYVSDNGKIVEKKKSEFLNEWSSVALLAFPNDKSGEKDYKRHKEQESYLKLRLPLIFFSCLFFVTAYSFFQVGQSNWLTNTIMLILKFTGASVVSMLLWYEVDSSNSALKQICGSLNEKSNCSSVLKSKYSKLFNRVSWSELGFIYFVSGFVFFSIVSENALIIGAWLNLIVLPYTIFSVYLQWRVIKQWCPLCLTVQALFILEFITTCFGYWRFNGLFFPFELLTEQLILTFLFSLLLPIIFLVFAKQVITKSNTSENLQRELNRLKYNPDIFKALLPNQQQIKIPPPDMGIILGNPQASNTIVKVCNPYCGPCAKAHPFINDLIEKNDDVKVQIIFTATSKPNDYRAEPVKHFMALYEKKNNELLKSALHDWYTADRKVYKTFASKYVIDEQMEKQNDKLDVMNTWCREMEVMSTPTFFINGNKLPLNYTIEDVGRIFTAS